MPSDPSLPRKLRALREHHAFESMAVLDVACGRGTYLEHFGPGSVGLDRNPGPARARGLAVLERDLDRPGWSVNLPPFDLVWLCDALVHLRDPEAFLRELRTALGPGAPLAIVEWLEPDGGLLRRRVARAFPGARAHWRHPEHLHRFTLSGIERLLIRNGFAVERSELHSLPTAWIGGSVERSLLRWWPPRTVLARAVGADRALRG